MKLKFLSALVAGSATALTIGIPSIAETVKESQIKLEPTGIGNKDYRNKQSTPSIVGSWKSSVNDNEYSKTDPQEIYWDIDSNGRTTIMFRREGQRDNFNNSTYQYAPTKKSNLGAFTSKNSQGTTFLSAIKWISRDEFVLTLINDSNAPHRRGIQRRYVRIQEPVATSLQQRAQQRARQAVRTNRENAALRRSQQNYNNAYYGLKYYPSGF